MPALKLLKFLGFFIVFFQSAQTSINRALNELSARFKPLTVVSTSGSSGMTMKSQISEIRYQKFLSEIFDNIFSLSDTLILPASNASLSIAGRKFEI